MTGVEDETKGLELGAVDYITKPISPPIVLARVATHLKIKASADFLRDKNAFLESEVARRTREVSAIQDVTIIAMASLAETRDNDTGNHIRRTQFYVKALAEHLKTHPRFRSFLTEHTINMLFKSAPLHDIGKVGIPDRILLKPGRFTPEEFEIMKTHTTLGRDSIQAAEDRLGMKVEFLHYAKEIAYYHQEKWDGSGYPTGKAGDDIPTSARLMAVADVYDALISRRVYKDGMPHAAGGGDHGPRPRHPLRPGHRRCLRRAAGRVSDDRRPFRRQRRGHGPEGAARLESQPPRPGRAGGRDRGGLSRVHGRGPAAVSVRRG